MKNLLIKVNSKGTSAGSLAQITLDNEDLAKGNYGEGLNVAIINEYTGELIKFQNFNTAESTEQSTEFAKLVEGLTVGKIVAIAIKGKAIAKMSHRTKRACQTLGSSLIFNVKEGDSWAIIGQKGAAPGSVQEQWSEGSIGVTIEKTIDISAKQSSRIKAFEIEVLSEGKREGGNNPTSGSMSITKNGEVVVSGTGDNGWRGLNIAVFDENDGSVLDTQRFDTWGDQQSATNFANYINELPFGRLVAVAVCDEGARYITGIDSSPSGEKNQAAIDACKSLGSTKIEQLAFRNSWALIGYKGPIWGEAVEVLSSGVSAYCQYRFTPYTAQEAINYRVSVVSGGMGGINTRATAAIYVNQVPVLSEDDAKWGLNVVVIDKDSGFVISRQSFNCYGKQRASDFIDFIEAVPVGYIVAVSLKAGLYHITDAERYALQSIGSGLAFNLCSENSYAIIGIKGAAPGSVPEMLQTDGIAAVKSVFPVATIRQFNPFRVVTAISEGREISNKACITINGQTVKMPNGDYFGIDAVELDREGQVINRGAFDTFTLNYDTNGLVELIDKVNPENYVALAVHRNSHSGWVSGEFEKVKQVFQSLGSTIIDQVDLLDSWVLIGKKDGTKLAEAFARDGQGNATAVANLTVPIQGSSNDAVVSVDSAGTNFGNSARISLKGFPGEHEQYSYQNGVNVIIFNSDEGVKRFEYFDTIQSGKAEEFAALIEGLSPGTMVAIGIQGSNALTNSDRAVRACQSIGSSKIHSLSSKGSWAIVGFKGAAPGSVVEALNNEGATSCSMMFPTLEYYSNQAPLRRNQRMLGLPLIAWGMYELVSVIVSAVIVGGTAAAISSGRNTPIIEYGGGFSKQGGNITDKGGKLPQNNEQPSDRQPPNKDSGNNDKKQDRNNSQKENNLDEEKKHEANKRTLRVKALFVALDYKEEKEINISKNEKIKNTRLIAPIQRTQDLCVSIPCYLTKIYSLEQQEQVEFYHEVITDSQDLLGEKASKIVVENKLKKLIEKEKDYDVVYFHFAGHGENKPSLGIVLDDGIISIQELQNLFQLISSSSKLFCTLDCCYSGGIIDSIPGFRIASTIDGNTKGLELFDNTLSNTPLEPWVNFTYFLKDAIFKLNPPSIRGSADFTTSLMKDIKEKVIRDYNKKIDNLDAEIKQISEKIKNEKWSYSESEEAVAACTKRSMLIIRKGNIEGYRESTQKSNVEVRYAPEDKADKVFLQNLEGY
jgi:hypothetical protein